MADGYRHQRARLHASYLGLGWGMKLLFAVGGAGVIALTAQLSFPLPWTPVPFSFGLFGVLFVGAALGRSWGMLSIAIYVLAGALGVRVFADQHSPGWQVLVGPTLGYILGYWGAAFMVGWYVEERRRLLPRRAAAAILVLTGSVGLSCLVTLAWIATQGGTFSSAWSSTQSLLWLFIGMGLVALLAAVWLLTRARGLGWEKLNLFLVMVGAVAVIHICGVAVLGPTLGMSWPEAIALGSTVFLPFDIVKAALATAASLTFLPTRDEERHYLSPPQPR